MKAVAQQSNNLTDVEWLIQLRWCAAIGQVAVIFFVYLFSEMALPATPLASIISMLIVSNWILKNTVKDILEFPRASVGLILLFDTLLLTLLLLLTGGHTNPFTVFYLVHITLAAVVLGIRWAWGLVAFSSLCFAFLFFATPHSAHHAHDGAFSLHLQGMWIAFFLAAASIVYFLNRVVDELHNKNEALRDLERVRESRERLAALATLSAGAAHELATPLATIGLVVEELQRSLGGLALSTKQKEDLSLVYQQVERCRSIIDSMGAHGGSAAAENASPIDADYICSEIREALPDSLRARFTFSAQVDLPRLCLPQRGLITTLAALVKNGLDASDDLAPVELSIYAESNRLFFRVSDSGHGISPELLNRVQEPFFTTKPPGKGMGLGLYLAALYAEQIGGQLKLTSSKKFGTRVTLQIPVEEARIAA